MIKTEDGMTKFDGDLLDITVDFICIIEAFYALLMEQKDEETARKMIAEAGRVALMRGVKQ